MTTTEEPIGRVASAAQFAAITVVRDGDGYVLGNAATGEYVIVPEIGGQVMLWLKDGVDVAECADRAEQRAGQPVNVAGFVDGLVAAGVLQPADAADAPVPDVEEPARWQARLGRILFGRAGLVVQAGLAVTAVVAMVLVPSVRLAYTDLIVGPVPLVSLVTVTLLGLASGLVHECAHVLAAAAKGVRGRVTISRRLLSLAYQTDLTALWGLPRRDRIVPLSAGMLSDAATVGVLAVVQLLWVRDLSSPAGHLLRALLFLKATGIVVQLQVYMRTDVYALFVVATRCRNLWDTKGALARRSIGRATAADLTLLASVGRRDIVCGRIYLLLYFPGVAWTVWYFSAYGVPSTYRIATMAVHAVRDAGVLSASGAAGVAALCLMAVTTTILLRGLVRAAMQLVRQIVVRS
ncbi:hypothetical protein HDA40_008177 [Hamadaea flava]|uniref:Peptide zinc metalloprotease protein n=1 Tax=Hamadaea flava TaxID=1742688 RepID=A0ABV8LLR2_9ACTN|nr:hypothetical protein [Hamadaea flava]MCP2329670.1 hypothetical protein [Hamadaea flava]